MDLIEIGNNSMNKVPALLYIQKTILHIADFVVSFMLYYYTYEWYVTNVWQDL